MMMMIMMMKDKNNQARMWGGQNQKYTNRNKGSNKRHSKDIVLLGHIHMNLHTQTTHKSNFGTIIYK